MLLMMLRTRSNFLRAHPTFMCPQSLGTIAYRQKLPLINEHARPSNPTSHRKWKSSLSSANSASMSGVIWTPSTSAS